MIEGRAGDGHVGLLRHQRLDDVPGGQRFEEHLGMRESLQQPGGGARHQLQAGVGAGQHPQRAVVAEAQVRGHVLHVLHAPVDLLDLRLKGVRLRRGNQARVAPLEERDAQLDLQMPDQPADAGLGDVQKAGGVGGRSGRHDRAEHFDLSKIHGQASVETLFENMLL